METADIVIPVERYSLVYEIPVGLPHRLPSRVGTTGKSGFRGDCLESQPGG